MQGMASVPYEDSFLLVGGYDMVQGDNMNSIYRFDPRMEEFKLMVGSRLRTKRMMAVALLVDADAFPKC